MLMNRQGLLALLVGLMLCLGTTAVLAQDYDDDDYDEDVADTSYGYDDDTSYDSGDGDEDYGRSGDGDDEGGAFEAKGSLEEQWFAFLGYIDVANSVAARSYGQAILQAGKPVDLYRLTTLRKSDRWDSLLLRGAKLEGMSEIVASLRKMIEEGYQSQRASVDFIKKAIDGLGDSVRASELNKQRLVSSGEYAMPLMIHRMVTYLASDQKDPKETIIFQRLVNTLPYMGKIAVRPLCEVLQSDDPKLQQVVVNALKQIEYPHSAPALRELAVRPGVQESVKKAAEQALTIVKNKAANDKSPAALYYELAEAYYANNQSLQPDGRSETANVWYWKNNTLTYKPVPSAIFTDVYAMRMAAEALKHDGTYHQAVSLWLSANLRREANLPSGAKDTTMASAQMPAEFYALASSAKYLQDVLARALKDNNSAVAMGAIKALSQTVGSKSLVGDARNVGSLVRALSHADRQVRFMAAIALANSLPTDKFSGQDLVPNVLNEALRQTGQKVAVVVVADEATRNSLKDAVRAAGFDVIDEANVAKAMEAIRGTAGVDAVVVAREPSARQVASALRQDPLLAGIPIVAADASQEFATFARSDKRAIVLRDIKAEPVAVAMKEALELGGSVSAESASDWAVQAAAAAYLLGLTNNGVIDVARVEAGLLPALDDSRSEVQMAAAKALSVQASAKAQQGIAALAIADGDDKVRMAAFEALTNSVKKFGNQTTEAQSAAVIEIVNSDSASPELRQAAAAALGAMNLPSEKIKSMILGVNDSK